MSTVLAAPPAHPDAQALPFAAPSVEAELNYLAPGTVRPVNYTFEPPAGIPWSSGTLDPRRVTIHNARPLAQNGGISLDKQGFQHVAHASALHDFSDEAQIRDVYLPEAEALLRTITGAAKVVIFDHTLRDSARGSRANAALREPVRRVHNDQTFVFGAEARSRSSGRGRSRAASSAALRDHQSVAAFERSRAIAARTLRRTLHCARRSRTHRSRLP